MNYIIEDKELGPITVQANARAKRYILRVKDGAVYATLPAGGSLNVLKELVEKSRPQLREAIQRLPAAKDIFDEGTDLQTNTFRLHIFRTDRINFYMNLQDGILHIACPDNTDFHDERVQGLLRQMLEKALRHEARRILPRRLQSLARQHGFTYTAVKINNSKSRWGSCSAQKSINLSLSLMLLPDHLIDYVLLHELCHTREMNHSPRFWELMDSVTDRRALTLRSELKTHRIL